MTWAIVCNQKSLQFEISTLSKIKTPSSYVTYNTTLILPQEMAHSTYFQMSYLTYHT